MTTFVALSIELNLPMAFALIPIAAIGHVAGLKAHQAILLLLKFIFDCRCFFNVKINRCLCQ